MHSNTKALTHTHTNIHIYQLPNYYTIAIIYVNKANLRTSCGAPMEAPTEACGVAEGVVG